jgi:hypothetical protein
MSRIQPLDHSLLSWCIERDGPLATISPEPHAPEEDMSERLDDGWSGHNTHASGDRPIKGSWKLSFPDSSPQSEIPKKLSLLVTPLDHVLVVSPLRTSGTNPTSPAVRGSSGIGAHGKNNNRSPAQGTHMRAGESPPKTALSGHHHTSTNPRSREMSRHRGKSRALHVGDETSDVDLKASSSESRHGRSVRTEDALIHHDDDDDDIQQASKSRYDGHVHVQHQNDAVNPANPEQNMTTRVTQHSKDSRMEYPSPPPAAQLQPNPANPEQNITTRVTQHNTDSRMEYASPPPAAAQLQPIPPWLQQKLTHIQHNIDNIIANSAAPRSEASGARHQGLVVSRHHHDIPQDNTDIHQERNDSVRGTSSHTQSAHDTSAPTAVRNMDADGQTHQRGMESLTSSQTQSAHDTSVPTSVKGTDTEGRNYQRGMESLTSSTHNALNTSLHSSVSPIHIATSHAIQSPANTLATSNLTQSASGTESQPAAANTSLSHSMNSHQHSPGNKLASPTESTTNLTNTSLSHTPNSTRLTFAVTPHASLSGTEQPRPDKERLTSSSGTAQPGPDKEQFTLSTESYMRAIEKGQQVLERRAAASVQRVIRAFITRTRFILHKYVADSDPEKCVALLCVVQAQMRRACVLLAGGGIFGASEAAGDVQRVWKGHAARRAYRRWVCVWLCVCVCLCVCMCVYVCVCVLCIV